MREETPGIYCQICGARMDVRIEKSSRKYFFACPHCKSQGPVRNTRGQAAIAARECDMIKRSAKKPVLCPFYMRPLGAVTETDCEAPTRANRLRMRFDSEQDKKHHMARFCRGAWRDCPIAKACEEKYKAPGD